jgi:hypothetical protein
MTPAMETISYLRRGRKLRASGTIITTDQKTRMTKVKPSREDWGIVWLDEQEITAGKEKPPMRPREKRDAPAEKTKPKRQRAPKPEPLPRWKQLVADVRTMEIDHVPDGWPAVRMGTLSALADELEAAHAKLAEFLPISNDKG